MKLKFLLSFQIFAVFKITALKLFFNAENIFCSEKIKQTESLKHDYIGFGFHFSKNRSTRAKMFYKIGVPKMFAKFTGKHLYRNVKIWQNFSEHFFFTEYLRWLLLEGNSLYCLTYVMMYFMYLMYYV